jgi:hypothetical protein
MWFLLYILPDPSPTAPYPALRRRSHHQALFKNSWSCCASRPGKGPSERWRSTHPVSEAQKRRYNYVGQLQQALESDPKVQATRAREYDKALAAFETEWGAKKRKFKVVVSASADGDADGEGGSAEEGTAGGDGGEGGGETSSPPAMLWHTAAAMSALVEQGVEGVRPPLQAGDMIYGYVRSVDGKEWLLIDPPSQPSSLDADPAAVRGELWVPLVLEGDGGSGGGAAAAQIAAWLEEQSDSAMGDPAGGSPGAGSCAADAEEGVAEGNPMVSSPLPTPIIAVVFTQPGQLGLHFDTTTPAASPPTLERVRPGTQAATHAQLTPGLVLRRVDGAVVLDFNHGMQLIKGAGRPVTLEFVAASGASDESFHLGHTPKIFHEGWLYKTRMNYYLPFKSSHERWFELRGQTLRWFDSDGGTQLGERDMTGCTVTPTESCTFHVQSRGRDDILRAATQNAADQWVQCLRGDSAVNLKELLLTLEDSYSSAADSELRSNVAVLRSSVFGIADHEIVPTRHDGADKLQLLLDELWKQYDADGNGTLGTQELRQLVADYVKRQEVLLPDKLKAHARRLLVRASELRNTPALGRDANVGQYINAIEDGLLEITEQTSAKLMEGVTGTASRAFQAIDQDNDGFVNKDEFQHRFIHYMDELVAEPPLAALRKLLIRSFPELFPSRHTFTEIAEESASDQLPRVELAMRSTDAAVRSVTLQVGNDSTVTEIKQRMLAMSKSQGSHRPQSFVVRIDDPLGRSRSSWLTAGDEGSSLSSLLPSWASYPDRVPRLDLVQRSTFRLFAAQHIQREIRQLTTGASSSSFNVVTHSNPEVTAFHSEMRKLREALQTGCDQDAMEQAYLNQRVRLQPFAETTLADSAGHRSICCRVFFGKHSLKLPNCDVNWTASKVISLTTVKPVFQLHQEENTRGHLTAPGRKGRARGRNIQPASTYVLKVLGFDDYLLAGGDAIGDVLSVRDQLYHGAGDDTRPVDFMLITKECAEENLATAVTRASAFDLALESGESDDSHSDSDSDDDSDDASVPMPQPTSTRRRGRTRAQNAGRQQWWSNLDTPFSVIVRQVEGLNKNGLLVFGTEATDAKYRVGKQVYAEFGAYFGDAPLASSVGSTTHVTPTVAVAQDETTGTIGCTFDAIANMGIAVRDLPRACVLCFTLKTIVMEDGVEKHRPLGWVNTHVFDHTGLMQLGVRDLYLWPDAEANPIATCVEPSEAVIKNRVQLTVEFCIGADPPLDGGAHNTAAKIYHSDEFYNVRRKQRQSMIAGSQPSVAAKTLDGELATLRDEQYTVELGAVIDVEVWENQRRHPLHDNDFHSSYVLLDERRPWSDDDGVITHSGKDDPCLLREGFAWLSEWRLEGHDLHCDVDDDGWMYAAAWTVGATAWHSEKQFDDMVRRRRWIRTMSPIAVAKAISDAKIRAMSESDPPSPEPEPEPETAGQPELRSTETRSAMSGWLWKRGGSGPKDNGGGFFSHGRRNWKRRWFVVVQDKLLYYESQEDFVKQKAEKGFFLLWDGWTGTACQVADGDAEINLASGVKGHGLTLISPQRIFLLAATDPTEHAEWKAYLREVLDLDPPSRDAVGASADVASGPWHSLHQLYRYRAIITSDPMWKPAKTDPALLYTHRHRCQQLPEALPKFLQVINWADQQQREETIQLVQGWATMSWEIGLQLMDARYAHALVRSQATHSLEQMGDDQLIDVMLQLVQTLKYEPYHSNALASFLLKRALKCPSIIGHRLYWYLRSEMHVPVISERFGLMLDGYVKALPPLVRERMVTETDVVKKLMEVGSAMKDKSILPADRNAALRQKLREIELPSKFRLPLAPRFECCGINIDKCFVLDSAQRPLWLVFQNQDTKDLSASNMVAPDFRDLNVILKKGDDLRQDILTLQMMKIMDNIWKSEGMDLGARVHVLILHWLSS